MKLKFLKAFLIVTGISIILISISGFEEAYNNQNYLSVVIAIIFAIIGIVLIVNGVNKKMLHEVDQAMLSFYSYHIKELQNKIIELIRGSELYDDLIIKLKSIEKKQDRIIQLLEEKE